MKKTAVEWLEQKLIEWAGINSGFHTLFDQAKAMEKQQIKEAYCKGDDNIGAEQYYNEKFLKNITPKQNETD